MGLLDQIVAAKTAEHRAFLASLTDRAAYRAGVEASRGKANLFLQSLRDRRVPRYDLAVIAECKKASPSSGLLREDYDAARIAKTYAGLGAAAVSVLTDSEFFQGSLFDAESAAATGIPVLRKDFILYEEQIYEAARIGASAVLLIVRLLDDRQLRSLKEKAAFLHLDVLVETHNLDEVRRALDAGSDIIGINHRDLDTLSIDLSLTEKAAPLIREKKPDALIVAESGVEDGSFLSRIRGIADAVLIGTYFMKAGDIKSAWNLLFG